MEGDGLGRGFFASWKRVEARERAGFSATHPSFPPCEPGDLHMLLPPTGTGTGALPTIVPEPTLLVRPSKSALAMASTMVRFVDSQIPVDS